MVNLQNNNWKIKFSWVKAHAGNYGNKTADKLAKEAARSQRNKYEYNRIPISAINKEAVEAVRTWETEWATSTKAANTRKYYLTVRDRLRMKIHLTPQLTAVLSGHGKTKA